MTRALWKGVIALEAGEVPVKLISAAIDRRVHFRLLHAADGEPVRQRLVHPRTGREVPSEEARRGLAVEPGLLVALSDEELSGLAPPSSRRIEVVGFLAPRSLPPAYYQRPYHLVPDGEEGPYLALHEALARRERLALVRWVMRRKRYVGVVGPRAGAGGEGARLLLQTLHAPEEVVELGEVSAPSGRALEAGERRLAEQLIAALEGPFELERFEEGYQRRVRELVEAKAKGRAPKPRKPRYRRPTRRLEEALRASLKAAKEGQRG